MPRFKDQAICIRHLDWSETSQIVALLTEQHGKVRGIAKGSKRMSPGTIARFSGGIELLTTGQIVAASRRGADLATVTEWDLQEPHWHLRENLDAQRVALYATDVTNAMLPDLDPHPAVFAAMDQLLRQLKKTDRHATALLRFQWALLEDCGFRLQLDEDVAQSGPLAHRASYTFDPARGGFTVDRTDGAAGTWGVRLQTLQLLRTVAAGGDIGDALSVERANRLLCVYLRTILDRSLPTMDGLLQ